MAYSTLLSLENTISQILDDDRLSIYSHEREYMISLDKCVVCFQAFLEDFPEKAKILEARIRDLAAEAEDIIELFQQEHIQNNYTYTEWDEMLRRLMFQHQLKKVRDEMDSVAAEVAGMKNSAVIGDILGDFVGATSSSQVADTGEINVVGFDEELIGIKGKLCAWVPELQVLPISGMGGIGKTTLARNAYDDQLIVEHFQIRAWVTVSQSYSQGRTLLDLLDSMKEFDPNRRKESMEKEDEKVDESKKELTVHKILCTRRFLIVLDDIWSTNVVDDVKHLFPNKNNGSRIMLTTRLKEVATYANTSILPHEISLMDPDQSWNLLCQKVFVHPDRVPRDLESIEREIARSCGGLPLAIVVVAGLLSKTSMTPTTRKEVAKNIRTSLAATSNGRIEKILSLSYNHLPHHLRPCFLYMGGFPEDHEIKVSDLIRLWIAESFVKPAVSKEFEDSAEEYLEDLVDRSLIIVSKRKLNGKIKCCSLHDMVREMCIKLSHEETFLLHVKGAVDLPKSMNDHRRISIYRSHLFSLINIHNSTIRTMMFFDDQLFDLRSFESLKVLYLLTSEFQSREISDQFFKLLHLRYLAVYNATSVPRTISNLQSLQTLVIKSLRDSSLPYEIWNMQQLRHLIVCFGYLANTHADTPALENLQTLGIRNLKCSVSTLNLIPNLRRLRLKYYWGSKKFLLHNLVHLRRLEKLHLQLLGDSRPYGKPNLVVPSSLKELNLIGWGSRNRDHLEIVGPFPNLEVLKLKRFGFMQGVWRTNDEEFPQLKSLLIEKSNLREWNTESRHFPRLEALLIRYTRDLSEIPECIGEIPTLELIEVKWCRDSLADSAKQIQEEAECNGDDAFQVRCIGCKPIEDLQESSGGEAEPLVKSEAFERFYRIIAGKEKSILDLMGP